MASISLEHIKKTYEDGVTVIPDLNLEIRDREFLILVGPFRLRQVHHSAYDCRVGGHQRRHLEDR